jgi:PadR family transcriptional regulator, regulatory protein PadR
MPAEWLRGTLDLCVLGVIAEGGTYGYAITERLEQAGLGVIKGGTLYPLLTRLETQALVSATWQRGDGGPARKYLHLTERGHAELRQRRVQWRQFIRAVDAFARLPETEDDHA